MPPYGWAQTALGPLALERYQLDISRLSDAMRIARRLSTDLRSGSTDVGLEEGQVEGDGPDGAGGQAKAGPAACGCGRKMRMAPTVLAQGPVLCGLCGQDFSTERTAGHRTEPELAASVDDRFIDRRRGAPEAEHASGPALGPGDPTHDAIRRSGLNHLTRLAVEVGGVALIAELGAWREAQRQGDSRPILVTTDAERRQANDAARALLKIEGELSGNPMIVAGREVLIGELVMVGEHEAHLLDLDARELPPTGVLGTVVDSDRADGVLEVDFAIAGRHRLDATSPAAAALDYAYAERVAFVGAPLLDLRTLPELDRADAVELAAVPELSW